MEERLGFPHNAEEEAWLREGLDQIARSRVPPDRDLWPALHARLFAPASRPAWRWRRPPGWGWLAAGLALVMALVGMAYARPLWEAFLSTHLLEQGGRMHTLSLSQTRDGITVTIERLYADANRIVIGYRIRGLPTASEVAWLPLLTLEDREGRQIPKLMGEGVAGASEILGLALPAGEIGGADSFDPWGLPGWPTHRPAALDLRLRVILHSMPQQPHPPQALHIISSPDATSMEKSPSPATAPASLSGPSFVFDLRIPVESEAEIYGPHTVRAHGLDLMLERWVRAPSGIRARVCFIPPDPSLSWTAMVEQAFAIGPEVVPNAHVEGPASKRTLTVTIPILTVPLTRGGGWMCQDALFAVPEETERDREGPIAFRVVELIGWGQGSPEPAVRRPGPWEFLIPVAHR
ncbi:MAG: DUF4179 domain-containing protein [Anaerolineae bacterium]|uniref:DUF4179 domain-containing protein n=1 Tax=Thermoflexus sp. TaxID=1969742 RepID=UPI0025EB04D9|nr:DUF4179 domain-containing protein [Thermoflexus sp.]MCS7351861.1 DUF4179 domain-containing protein [Thermoflexus sp.]MDW8181320.1 DUF4179 domain-containing protein [Anaerolineae bacterium]